MGTDRHARIQQRAYQIWEREGRPDGHRDRHWQQAIDELDRDQPSASGAVRETVYGTDIGGETAAPAKARSPGKKRADKGDVLAEEALAIKTGISGDEAERLIDKTGGDLDSAEQAARMKATRDL